MNIPPPSNWNNSGWRDPRIQPVKVERKVSTFTLFGGISNDDPSLAAGIEADKATDELHILIDSEGGDVRMMVRIIDAIHNHPAKTKFTHCLGRAFSASGAVFLVGDIRLMVPESAWMCHNVWNRSEGDTGDVCMQYSEVITDLIAMRVPEVHRARVREWMHAESFVPYSMCWGMGLSTGLDLKSTPRCGIEIPESAMPKVDDDFPATRAFEQRLEQKSAAESPAPVRPVPQRSGITPAASDLEYDRRARLNPRTIVFPPMPASLRGHVYTRPSDMVDIVEKHNACVAKAGDTPFNRWQAQESERVLKTILRFQQSRQGML